MSKFEKWLPNIRSKPDEWLATIIRSGDADLAVGLIRDHPHLLEARLSGKDTPLLVAAYSEQHQIAETLLAMGAKMGFIAAIALGRTGIVRAMLAENHLLVRKHSDDGWSALHIAARYATTETIALLISSGADGNMLGRGGVTPLFFATKEPYDNARLLLANGANIDAFKKHGFTTLHCAAAAGNTGFVRFLIAHGANANLQTSARQTAWSLAVRYGHRSVTALLAAT